MVSKRAGRKTVRRIGLVAVALVMAGALATARAAGPLDSVRPEGEECAPAAGLVLTVGTVDCFRLPSTAMGGEVPVSYYVPPSCDPAIEPRPRCPVLYYLHGTGGSYREGVGTKGSSGNAWVEALTSGPRVDPRRVPDPWNHGTDTWGPRPALDLVIVSPHGATLPGGHGPAAHLDTGWFDWNPRYAKGGDTPLYGTPPPRPSTLLAEELVPFVDTTFPTHGDRQYRAILGYSQGGFGSYVNGLLHPDVWSSMGMRSGGGLPLLKPADAADDPALANLLPRPVALPHGPLPGVAPTALPDEVRRLNLVSEVALGFGDPVADQTWWRASNPTDLVANARARAADGTQSLHLKHFVNDAIPREPVELLQRLTDPDQIQGTLLGQFYETVLYPTNLYLERSFDQHGVERTFHVGPGDHTGRYGVPYFREQLEHHYANLQHADGGGNPRPVPARFDYRSAQTDFAIWGWHVAVEREAVEFLNLTDVSCAGFTVRGSGIVTVTVPAGCGTGADGSPTIALDLGPSAPLDAPGGLDASSFYGRTVTVGLSPLS